MGALVRQILLTMTVSLYVVYAEPALSNQYGVPGNYNNNFNGNNYNGNNYNGNNYNGNNYNGNNYNGNNGNYNNDYDQEHQDHIDSQPKSYEFGYAVKDAATGNDFGRQETSDGETVRGEYRVQLPDGRTQIVTYTADWRTGFHADVRYEGVATYPDQYNTNNGFNNNNNNNNNFGNQGYDYQGNSGNNYRPGNGNYNNNQYNGYNNFGGRNGYSDGPSPTYGPAFNK